MQTFQWNPLFETGLQEVDAQHQRLVTLVNDLADLNESGGQAQIDACLGALAEYTVYHFACEERLMGDVGVDRGYFERHRDTHRKFVQQVTDWMGQRHAAGQVSLAQLLDYLANWLIFHILGDDQSMGRQVAAIREGADPHLALLADKPSDDPRTVILLGGLHHLYADLLQRNERLAVTQKALTDLNNTLEQRVADRTAALQAANDQIREEQERVVGAEKMASLGRMVAGFAHEVNTPVGVAVGAISQMDEVVRTFETLLRRDEVTEVELHQQLHYLKESGALAMANLRRAAGLIQSFKRTAVDQSSEQTRGYLLDELIADVVHTLQPIFKRTEIRISINCPAKLLLSGIPGALTQVLTNLILNCHTHAFAEGSRSGLIQIDAILRNGDIDIAVSDDGTGMDEAALKHAFEPFFTTRRNRGGSGLGLYISYNLVTHQLGGSITCESSPATGTCLRIRFPYQAAGNGELAQ
jgi:hemerythrin-like metal-binding protein